MRTVENMDPAALGAHPPVFHATGTLHLTPEAIDPLARGVDAEAARFGE